jgi:hypothetical protein
MSNLNFPVNPTVGQTFTSSNKTYVWNGYGWSIVQSQTSSIVSQLSATNITSETINIAGTSTINGALIITTATIIGNAIPLGIPLDTSLVDNNPAILTWTSATYVTNAIDDLNEMLGKLIPPQPPVFPGSSSLSILGLPSAAMRISNFTQTDHTATKGHQLSAGSAITAYKRSSSYATNQVTNVGPGDTGTVTVVVNGITTGSHTMVAGTSNGGTYNALVISNNVDYGTISNKTTGFWTSFNASATGNVAEGWNEIYLTDTEGTATNTVNWYYDASTPGTPQITQTSFIPSTSSLGYSSSVPHYTSSAVWTYVGTVNRLSGDMYPTSDTFLTGNGGGVFGTPASLTYSASSITTPLARNLYVASGSTTVTTTVGINNATSSSTTGPVINVDNGYSLGTFTLNPNGTVLTINTSDTSKPNENNIIVGSFGSGGSASAVRVGGLPATQTPTTGSITSWTSQNSLVASDATIVAGVIRNDKTNYSTGYFPPGPDLRTQANIQYITFRIQRAATSKFNISFSGRISGCYVAMPGSSLDTTAAATNGWVTPTVAYAGAGVPGASGNGSNGCAIGGVMTVGSAVTQSITVTFGTESSSNSTNNYIYVRFTLENGDSISALSFPNPTN